eukprot:scaffold616_cov306-Pavlova_lutheri.AAC.1
MCAKEPFIIKTRPQRERKEGPRANVHSKDRYPRARSKRIHPLLQACGKNECQGPAPFPAELAFPKKDGPAGRAVCPGTQQRPMPSANSSSNHPQVLAFDGGHRELMP